MNSSGRESACPVHFIWDGHGRGRALVRLGFMMLVALGMLATGLPLLGVRNPSEYLGIPLVLAVLVYGAGQGLSALHVRRRRAR